MSETTGPDLQGESIGEAAVTSEARPESAGPAALPPAGAPRPLLSAAWDLLHDVSITVLFCFFIVTFVAQPVRVQGAGAAELPADQRVGGP